MSLVDPIAGSLARLAELRHLPATAAGHVHEAAATVATMGLWPLGLAHRSLVDDERGQVPSIGAKRNVGVERLPVVLVHGYGANRSNWWFVERRLRASGRGRIHAVNYQPWTSDLPALAAGLAQSIDDAREHFGVERVHVVGHSLGGIVARYAVSVLGLEGVATMVTVASPHGGVPVARHAHPVGGLGRVARQLRPDADELVLMRASARRSATRFVGVAGALDVVVPADRARIVEPELDATNLVVSRHGHFSLLFSHSLAAILGESLALGDVDVARNRNERLVATRRAS